MQESILSDSERSPRSGSTGIAVSPAVKKDTGDAYEFKIPKSLGNLPVLTFLGTHQEIGEAHGRRLRYAIAECVKCYDRVLKDLTQEQRSSFVAKQRALIERHFPQYAEEICAMAKSAGISEEVAFSLNCRTELALYQHTLQTLRGQDSPAINECTLVGSSNTRIMGQTWDWADSIERITILNHIIRPDGHRILTMTEPGIIGKVGMNSAGIGVGLNFIPGNVFNPGIPVHILLRACLDATSFEQISTIMDKFCREGLLGTLSAISVMDRYGNAEVYEILGRELIRTRNPNSDIFSHTNHPIGEPARFGISTFTDPANSIARLEDANKLAQKAPLTIETLGELLSDRSNSMHSINMLPQAWGNIGNVQTIRSLMFDLENGIFFISKGAPGASADPVRFESVKLY